MNVDRCIALHNEILRHGWIGSGRSAESLESSCRNWFDTFGDAAEAVRADLAPDLVQFLQHARVISDPESKVDLFFFYWVQNLAEPEFMFEQEEDWPEEGRFLVLYAMSNFTGHFCGLVYDQETHLCIMSPTIYDTDMIFEQEVWYPLEAALEFWLAQIRKGRIATPPPVQHRNYVHERFDPWEFIPYNEIMLEENIDAFNRLVESIEARMPSTADTAEVAEAVDRLVDSNVLEATDLPRRFAYDFLRRVRRPRFQMIAPGLEVLNDTALLDQPFRSRLSSSTSEIPPILLFRFESDYTDQTVLNARNGERIAQLFPQFSSTTTYPAGLYLRPASEMKSEDECVFVLPFGIGANGYARRSEGSRFGRRRTGENSHVDLYRPGYQPLENHHEQSLVDVLKSWRGMVERGDWQVDENGVAGGIDVWREADSEEKWEAYVIPRAVEGVEG